MNRKEFLQLCTGIIGGLGINGYASNAAIADGDDNNQLGTEYLVKGLTGMASTLTRPELKKWWFDGHYGAAVLAGYYLCKENSLDRRTVAAIKAELDKMIESQAALFAPFPDERVDAELIENVPKALGPAIDGGIRAGGHAVIFAALSTKALGDVPDMAQPTIVRGLTRLSRNIAKSRLHKPDGEASYSSTQAMIDATFDSVARFKDVLGRPSIKRPNFTHMFTHTDALMTLDTLGYADLVKAGHAGHSVHIGPTVPRIDREIHPKSNHATLDEVMHSSFWENKENQAQWSRKFNVKTNRNGLWLAAGHLFKVLYAFHRLSKQIKDEKKVRLCSMLLLERYFNPDVQGG